MQPSFAPLNVSRKYRTSTHLVGRCWMIIALIALARLITGTIGDCTRVAWCCRYFSGWCYWSAVGWEPCSSPQDRVSSLFLLSTNPRIGERQYCTKLENVKLKARHKKGIPTDCSPLAPSIVSGNLGYRHKDTSVDSKWFQLNPAIFT